LILVTRCLSIRSIVSGVQGDCRREWLRAKETYAKWKQRCQVFILLLVSCWTFVGPSEESMLLAKAVSKYLL
jgi:hypothetical protein